MNFDKRLLHLVEEDVDPEIEIESEINWYIRPICRKDPIPMTDGWSNIEENTIIALHSQENTIWFARVLRIHGDELAVQYFDMKPESQKKKAKRAAKHKNKQSKPKKQNLQEYFLIPLKQHKGENIVPKEAVCFSAVPMQPDPLDLTDDGLVTWRLQIPFNSIEALQKEDYNITSREQKMYSY